MDEWLKKIAQELGLPADAKQDVILGKLSEELLSGGTAKARLSKIEASAAVAGVKIEGDTVVKPAPVAASTAPRNPEDVARLAAQDLEIAKSRLAAGKATVEALCAGGKVPPALKEKLSRVFASTGKVESLALGKSGDSEIVIKGTIDVLEDLKAILSEVPSLTGGRLSSLSTVPTGDDGKPVAGALGRTVAARAMKTSKKEPAAK